MSTEPEDGADALARVLADFQSLGDNCEFGLVQRFAGIEPLGLFRFNNAALDALIAALDSDFRHYGEPGDLEIFTGYFDYLSCHSRRHGFIYSTGERAGTIEPGDQLQREYKKIAYLKRRLLEDLAAGEQILVRKGRPEESLDAVRALARAVRRHGPSIILRVREAEGDEQPGSVRWLPDRAGECRIMEGTIRRFSLYEGIVDLDLEPWIVLCWNAHRLARGLPGEPPPLHIASSSVRFPDRAQPHATPDPTDAGDPDSARPGLITRTVGIRAGSAAPGSIVVLSLWVWIPESFEGKRLCAVLGHHGLAWRDADLNLREAWQRIWVSARLPPKPGRLPAGFGNLGPAGQRFWSTDWRLCEGPIPTAGEAPTIGVGEAQTRVGGRFGQGLGRLLSGLTR